jgi:predicted TPR repeat methyltransferase
MAEREAEGSAIDRVSARRHFEQGNRLIAMGRLADAEGAFRRALEHEPGAAEAGVCLGNVLCALGRWDEAAEAYRAVLAGGFEHPLVHYNYGTALRHAGQAAAAAQALGRAVRLDPESVPARNNLGNALRDLGRWDEAAEAYLEALARQPGKADTAINLAGCLALWFESDPPGAAAAAARWLVQAPADPIAAHVGAAMTGAPPPERAEDAYVRQLFDSFAPDFEARLAGLDYQAPARIAAALEARPPVPGCDILDAGCGTGLCAPFLRPSAGRLEGVDLSPAMLAEAEARGLYDALFPAELTAFLVARPAGYDLIVAADVFCYFGELGPVLAAAAAALRPGGRLIATVEEAGGAAQRFRLCANGRYAHGEGFVRQSLAAAGLTLEACEPVVLRQENGRPVAGLLVQAGRP